MAKYIIKLKNDNIRYANIRGEKIPFEKANLSPAIFNLIEESHESFSYYLKRIGLSKGTNLIVLSSELHYYYDHNELNSVRTVINHKKLNLIKDLDAFLNTLSCTLPQDANFIGCLSDSKTFKGKKFPFYQPTWSFNGFINFLDSRTDHRMDKNEVSEALERNGFNIVDMTEIDGLTYFCSKNISGQDELSA
jgi:hypothetical protein